MSRDPESEDIITVEELSDLLADATNTDPEEFERQADEFEIGPPGEADVVSRE